MGQSIPTQLECRKSSGDSSKETAIIHIDDRKGSIELSPIIQGMGVQVKIQRLEFGDAAFQGHGPKGAIYVGIERKTLRDMLACIDDARFAGHQLPGMMAFYSKSYLAIEGMWRPGDGGEYEGLLMEGYRNGQSWGPLKGMEWNGKFSGRPVLYSKLFRYLNSIALSSVIITLSHNIWHTAYNICELYHWYQKQWSGHTSLLEKQKLNIPQLSGRPSLVRRWAAELDDIGVMFSQDAERIFHTPVNLANSDEGDWLRIKGIGVPTAQKIIRSIRGWGQ
jgi:hypothetical protein